MIEAIKTVTQLCDGTVQVRDGVLENRQFGREKVSDALLDACVDLLA